MDQLIPHLQRAMLHDITVIQHLLTKMPEPAWDYRPQENMRSSTELLRYLSYIGASTLEMYLAGGFLPENMGLLREARERTAGLQAADFHDAFETQKARIRSIFASVTDSDLYTRRAVQPGNHEGSLLDALLNGPLKYLASYKMQLFIYANQCGANIVTANGWRGVDPVPAA